MKLTKKMSQRIIADLCSLPQSAISLLNKKGVDIYDSDAIEKAIMAQHKQPLLWQSGCPWKKDSKKKLEDQIPETPKTREQLIDSALLSEDPSIVKNAKVKLEIIALDRKIKIADGEYILREEVKSDIRRLQAGVSSGLDGLSLELPAVCEGFTAAQMKGKIKIKTESVKRMLADGASELYPQPELIWD